MKIRAAMRAAALITALCLWPCSSERDQVSVVSSGSDALVVGLAASEGSAVVHDASWAGPIVPHDRIKVRGGVVHLACGFCASSSLVGGSLVKRRRRCVFF